MVMTISEFTKFRDMLKEQYQQAYSDWSKQMERLDELSQEEKKELTKLFFDWFDLDEKIHQMECQHVDECLKEALPQILCTYLNGLRKNGREKIDVIYSKYDEMRKDGLTFKERSAKLDMTKIERCEVWLSEPSETPYNIIVRPAQSWLPMASGYDRLKEIGITEFVRHNFMFMYDNKNNNENN